MVENTIALTCRDGLAYVVGSSAGPTQIIRSYTRDHSPAQPGTNTSAQYPLPCSSVAWRGNRRNSAIHKRLEGMEARRPDTLQHTMEKQDGKWYPKTTGQCGGLYHLSTPHRRGHRSDRLLALRQLLVSGPRNGTSDGGLTSAKRSSRSWRTPRPSRRRRRGSGHVFRRRGGKFVTWGPVFQSRERLATRRGIRKRRPEPLTSRPLRKEWGRHYG